MAFTHGSVLAELSTISGAGRAWDLNERPGLNGWSNCYHRVNLTTCSERLFRTFRFALSAMDMEQRDYDSRTALHVAAAEGNARTVNRLLQFLQTSILKTKISFCVLGAAGHVEVVKFLLEACKVNPFPKDR